MQVDSESRLLFASDPDHCCYLNKTQPMDGILRSFDVWINGVRADQSAVRAAMKVEQPAPYNTIRFHPMLDWNSKMIWQYQKEFNLPKTSAGRKVDMLALAANRVPAGSIRACRSVRRAGMGLKK
jgi:phosphoadenosine phosphosulfate reductase